MENLNLPFLSPFYSTIAAGFCQQVKGVPHNLAVADKYDKWNYEQLNIASNQLGHYLRNCGICNQDIVAIYAHRSAALVVALLGVIKAGAAFVILDSNYPASRLIDCLKLAKPQAWLQVKSAGIMPEILANFVSSYSLKCRLEIPANFAEISRLLKDASPEDLNIKIQPNSLAYIAFTSGSTGLPKAIAGTHEPVSHFLEWHIETFGLNETDRFSVLSGIAHDPLLRDIFTPLWLGASCHIPDPDAITTPGWLPKWMEEEKITVAHLTPAMGKLIDASRKIGEQKQTSNSYLRYAFFGGDMLSSYHVEHLGSFAPGVTCVNFYGATETPQAMGYFIVPPDKKFHNFIPIGRGIKDVQLLVLNSSMQLAGVGELGEIYIRTPYLSRGYLGDEVLNKQRFIINPFTNIPEDKLYKTGDLGRYLLDGNIAIAGRIDNQVKIRGFRIELGEIEAALNSYPYLKQTVVIALDETTPIGMNEPQEKRLVAYLVPQEVIAEEPSQNPHLNLKEIRNFLKEKLPEYMIPSAFVVMESLPITPNGKIDRRALPVPDFQRSLQETSLIAPRDAVEVGLVEIWEKVLGVKPIGIKDNYFELGGHSLLAVNLFCQIEEKFGKFLPLAALFQSPTIEQLAKIIRLKEWSHPWRYLVPLQTKGTKTPLFCVHAVGGNVFSYKGLADYLGEEQPVYGLQARGLDGREQPLTCVEEMATNYLREMRILQPRGPYLLAGHSLGGILVFEMAQQLVRTGEKVALLALFDTFSPLVFGQEKPPLFYQLWIHKFNLSRLKTVKEKYNYFRNRFFWRLETYIERISKIFYGFTGIDNPQQVPLYLRKIELANRLAVKNYTPQVYPGKLTLMRAIERPTNKYYEPFLGWQELAADGVEVEDIPGHHKTMILEPNIRVLAEKLKICIERCLAETEEG